MTTQGVVYTLALSLEAPLTTGHEYLTKTYPPRDPTHKVDMPPQLKIWEAGHTRPLRNRFGRCWESE